MLAADMFRHHKACESAYADAVTAVQQHVAVKQFSQAYYELLRANAAVAQGFVWSELLGITIHPWLVRMQNIDRLHETLSSL